MAHDETFRWILIVGVAAVAPVGLYHRIKARGAGEPLDRRQEGTFILFTLRPLALVTMAGFVAYLVRPEWMAWSSVALPVWMRWGGVVLGVAAGLLFVWVFRSLGTNLTDTVVTRREHTLVTGGPYRWVRHPFYVATATAVTANALVTANWCLLLGGWSIVILLAIRTAREEEHLVRRFGDEYRRFMETTPRFLPRVGRR